MSLLDGNTDTFDIDLYYKFIKVGSGRKLVIVPDDEAKELIKDEEKKKDIEKISTRWSFLTWKEQNEVMNISSQTTNPATGERQFNFLTYRDSIIKRCLKKWDIKVNGQDIPVSPQAIDQLPGPVVMALYQKFEKIMDYTEEEQKNS
jgi:hypothetical protein